MENHGTVRECVDQRWLDSLATFARRGTAIPEDLPDALTPVFSINATKQSQWEAFARDLAAEAPSLEAIVADLVDFLMPHARQARQRSRGSQA